MKTCFAGFRQISLHVRFAGILIVGGMECRLRLLGQNDGGQNDLHRRAREIVLNSIWWWLKLMHWKHSSEVSERNLRRWLSKAAEFFVTADNLTAVTGFSR